MKKIAIIKLTGGLGNTMFQYAFGLALKEKYNCIIYFDCSEKRKKNVRVLEIENFKMLKIRRVPFLLRFLLFDFSLFRDYFIFFKESLNIKSQKKISDNSPHFKIIRKKFILRYIYKSTYVNYDFEDRSMPYLLNFYQGYFQSPKYFEIIKNQLIGIFNVPKEHLLYPFRKLLVQKEDTIAIHVRRGDYISELGNYNKHGVLPIEYFTEAIQVVKKRKKNIKNIVFFSDEISWVKTNFNSLNLSYNVVYIDQLGVYPPNYELILLSRFCNIVISNSTFSWWSAWLSKDLNKIIVYPKIWFKNQELNKQIQSLFEENWIGL